jgi:Rps23 Pro-64 3,4-dihydroxylase Tpa1-like proline 4-hydroxylase
VATAAEPTGEGAAGEGEAARATDARLAIDPRVDVPLVAQLYRERGRVHVPGFLAPAAAAAVHAALERDTPWSVSANEGERNFTVRVEAFAQLAPEARAGFEARVLANAARGFQYYYKNFPIHDEYAAGRFRDHLLMRVYEFLNSSAFLDFARTVTGRPDATHVDAQATLFEKGHFLTRHDDRDDRKRRIAAYVLNLTPAWQADWGGLLAFLDPDGHVAEAYTPAFNALNLLRVPQPHAVTCVAPFAPAGRYSITGWIRAD